MVAAVILADDHINRPITNAFLSIVLDRTIVDAHTILDSAS